MLSKFCQKSFLKLWTYPNPYKDDGKELCDLIAVFGNDVFIFFDRNNVLPHSEDKDPLILWNRWKKNVIDKQTNTAHGAERYIRAGRSIFLDGKKTRPFPLDINIETANFHKIVVAHGAKEACLNSSPDNIYGSLGITYTDIPEGQSTESIQPFSLLLDKKNPVHIFDSHNLSIILSELDTVTDLANYLKEKSKSIANLDVLTYCGEEDLLAHYYGNLNKKTQQHFIGSDDKKINGVMISEGEWKGYIETKTYKKTKQANEISYLWDELIQRTCQYSLDGKLQGNADLLKGPSAIYEMVKEPRFARRGIAEGMMHAINGFPETDGFTRYVSLIPSPTPTTAYVFLQIQLTDLMKADPDCRAKRQTMLEIACGAAKNKFPQYNKIVGIGMEPAKYSDTISEDFILMPCDAWTPELRAHYENLNVHFNFFQSKTLKKREVVVSEFVRPQPDSPPTKVGRNEPCPCGSSKKYKKCCGN